MAMRPKSGVSEDLIFPKSWTRADQMTFVNRNLVDPTVASVELFHDEKDSVVVVRIWYAKTIGGGS